MCLKIQCVSRTRSSRQCWYPGSKLGPMLHSAGVVHRLNTKVDTKIIISEPKWSFFAIFAFILPLRPRSTWKLRLVGSLDCSRPRPWVRASGCSAWARPGRTPAPPAAASVSPPPPAAALRRWPPSCPGARGTARSRRWSRNSVGYENKEIFFIQKVYTSSNSCLLSCVVTKLSCNWFLQYRGENKSRYHKSKLILADWMLSLPTCMK